MTISEHELHAYLDGELDEDRYAEIEKLLAADSALAARVADFRSDKNRLGQVFGAGDMRPLPAEWLKRIAAGKEPQVTRFTPRLTQRMIGAIAATILLILGAWLTLARSGTGEDAIIAEALAARSQAMATQQVVDVSVSAPGEERNQVLSKALDMNVKAPDLGKLGYQLADIRIYSGVPGGKSVELRYRGEQNRVFTVYLRHPSGPPQVDLLQRDGLRICIWQDEYVGSVMLGEMSAGEMARAASAAYAGLTL